MKLVAVVSCALIAALSQAAVLLVDPTTSSGQVEEIALSCEKELANYCPAVQLKELNEDLLFGGIANHAKCLVTNKKLLQDQCFMQGMDWVMDVVKEKSSDDKECHDEVHDKCGKQIDEFKKAVQDTSVIGTLKGAVDVVECLIGHAEDLWKKCKPFEEDVIVVRAEAFEEEAPSECMTKAQALCPSAQNQVLGLGFTLGCLSQNVDSLGEECVKQRMAVALTGMESSTDEGCKDELDKKCGKQIEELKKELEETSIVGIVKSAVDVVQCVAQNAQDLWQKCNPFEEPSEPADTQVKVMEQATSNKPTKKPSKKPTAKATGKPTRVITGKPTQKHIMDSFVESSSFQEPQMYFEAQVTEVSSVEYDMEACVRSARSHCAYEVDMFNQNPSDKFMLNNLNQCIELNAALIEAECIVSSYRFYSFLPNFDYVNSEPCRHPEDDTSDLPVCEEHHSCNRAQRKAAKGIAASALFVISFLMFAKAAKLCLNREQDKNCSDICSENASGAKNGYEPLKSDNAPPVLSASIV
jgi:hypothetical protein